MGSNTPAVRRGEAGFTLIESLMAIGILSIVAVQILNVQSSSISVTQNSRDNMRATWAMRSTISQMEYALDSLGPKGLPKDQTFAWAVDNSFSVNVRVEDTPLEASRLLFTAMKMGNASGAAAADKEKDEDSEDPAGGMKEIGQLLDSQIPKDMYRTAMITVSWKEADTTRSLEGGMLVIDQSGLGQMGKMPNIPGMDMLGGGGGGDGGGGGGGGGDGGGGGGDGGGGGGGGGNTDGNGGGSAP